MTGKNHKDCVAIVTHRMDASMLRYLRFLKEQVTEEMDFRILFDCGAQQLNPEDYPDLQFHLFNSGQIENFFLGGCRRIPNPLLPLLDFAGKNDYRHYLVMEGDLAFTGDWRTFVRKIGGLDCDYIHIATDITGDPRHWPGAMIKDYPFRRLYFAWCHLFCVSRKLLTDAGEFIKSNDSIYYEFLLPSLAYSKGYYIRQFENFGYQFQVSWGPAEVYERKYVEERTENTFYHPIKNTAIIDCDTPSLTKEDIERLKGKLSRKEEELKAISDQLKKAGVLQVCDDLNFSQ